MPEPTLDQLLTTLEADLSEARGHILRLEDVIGGYKIEIRLLKEEISASDTELAMLREEICKLAPQARGRRMASPSRRVLNAIRWHKGHKGRSRGE